MNEKEVLELLRRHPEMAKYIEYVRPGKDGRRGYWRIKPYVNIPLKEAIEAGLLDDPSYRRRALNMLRFAEVSHSLFGTRGKEFYKGVEMPKHAVEIAKRLKGKRLPPTPSQAIKRLRRLLIKIGKLAEARMLEEEVTI